ncbi:MAG: phosphatase PAP2 family protein [Syntrophobacteraceae bacterium]|nr:phosphatase PAP2 family protein [Syntrophobacteraceae bacterium]
MGLPIDGHFFRFGLVFFRNHGVQMRPRPYTMIRESVSIEGLREATLQISVLIVKILILIGFSLVFIAVFQHIRAQIPLFTDRLYIDYPIYLDSLLFGSVPSQWLQNNIRSDTLAVLCRFIYYSYGFVLLLGLTIVYFLNLNYKKYLVALSLTIMIGLAINYIIPTTPPWMSLTGVIRYKGEYITQLDKNLHAAMPSLHQSVIAIFSFAVFRRTFISYLLILSYNLSMSFSLVYLGEHYVVDVLLGFMIAWLIWYGCTCQSYLALHTRRLRKVIRNCSLHVF